MKKSKKKKKKKIDLLKGNQNPSFPLAQFCAKPEKAMPHSAGQHKHLFITHGKI